MAILAFGVAGWERMDEILASMEEPFIPDRLLGMGNV